MEAHESDASVASEVTQARVTEPLKVGAETYEGELEMDYLSRFSPIRSPRDSGLPEVEVSPHQSPFSQHSLWVASRAGHYGAQGFENADLAHGIEDRFARHLGRSCLPQVSSHTGVRCSPCSRIVVGRVGDFQNAQLASLYSDRAFLPHVAAWGRRSFGGKRGRCSQRTGSPSLTSSIV